MAVIETITLPSRGIIYDGCPEEVQVKPFTTRVYKDLIASNGTEEGMNHFIDSCLVDFPVKSQDLHSQDKLAILFKIRSMTLGDDLRTEVRCPHCKNLNSIEWKLSDTEVSLLYVDSYPLPVHLPESNKDIKVKIPTESMLRKASKEAEKRAAKFNRSVSDYDNVYRAASPLVVDNMDLIERASWYENLPVKDAIFLDKVFGQISGTFGLDLDKMITCEKCKKQFLTALSPEADFFRSDGEYKVSITSKRATLDGRSKESNDVE